MDNKFLGKVLKALEPISENVSYIAFSGSSELDFIDSPRDCDVIVICATVEDCIECSHFLREAKKSNAFFKKNHIGTMVRSESARDEYLRSSLYPYYLRKQTYYRMDGTSFETSIGLDEFLSMSDMVKDTYRRRISHMESRANEEESEEARRRKYVDCKLWYYVYIGMSMFSNRSWEVTDGQKEMANILHDMDESTFEQREEEISKMVEALGEND